jgi:hypothetical protein
MSSAAATQEGGAGKRKRAEDAAAPKRRRLTAEEQATKDDKRKSNFVRKMDEAFVRGGKAPLGSVEAYAACSRATVELYGRPLPRNEQLENKADRYEAKGLRRRDAYESAGDTEEEDMYETATHNIVTEYVQKMPAKGFTSIAKIEARLAK